MLLIITITLGILLGLCFNAGRTIYYWLKHLGNFNPYIFATVYGLTLTLVLAVFLVSRVPGTGIPPVFFTIAHYGLGIILYIVMIFNFASLLILLARILSLLPTPIPKTVILATGAIAFSLAIALSLYGSINGAAIRTKHYIVHLAGSDGGQEPLKITLVSDIHLGYVVSENRLERIVARINTTTPDIVCFAGDIFDGDITSLENPTRLQELLQNIDAKLGVYACLGNHDAGPHYLEMLNFLEEAGVMLLQDETILVDNRVLLVGRKDSSPIGNQGAARVAAMTLPENNTLPVIVMDHQPGNIKEYGSETDLVLCGHSHRGQMFPFNLISKATYLVDYGYYTSPETGTQFIVTSGVGTWGPPFRIGSNNEVVAIQVSLP